VPRVRKFPATDENARIRAAIRIALMQRGMDVRQLAEAIGSGYANTAMAIAGANTSPRTRRRIENFLRQSLWCSAADFAERLALIDYFGADVEVLCIPELRELCLKYALLGPRTTNLPRGYFLDQLMIHYHAARSASPQNSAS
jgi:hypothetical protein